MNDATSPRRAANEGDRVEQPSESRWLALDRWTDAEILAARPVRNQLDVRRPYAQLVEQECSAVGRVETVATVFLTNRECPFRCLMCDLWKNTTTERVPAGAIPAQIEYALEQLPPARHIKLYNSGNFFDAQAIPPEDHPRIAELVGGFETVIVENHPRLCGPKCVEFQQRIAGQLEVALGLETVHPDVLPRLNKQMTLDDFRGAASVLRAAAIELRTFILLRPPGLSEAEGLEWAVRSLDFAFDQGVRCAAIIPTRDGNGAMEELGSEGWFSPPAVESLEAVMEAGLQMNRGRVLVDLWDFDRFARCDRCREPRRQRLQQMNLTQIVLAPVSCSQCAATT